MMAVMAVSVGIMLLGGTGVLRNVKYHLGMWDFTYTKMHEVTNYKDIDVLFIGSSHCYRTFDTRIFTSHGLCTFNLGSSNQTPLQTLMLLRLYLDFLSPRLVVIEVHPDLMCNDGIESSIYLANNMLPSFEMMRMSFSTQNLKSVLSMSYSAVRNTLFGGYSSYTEPLEDNENEYIPGGFVEHKGGFYRPEPHQPVPIVIKDCQLDALRECVTLLRKNGIPYFLVEVPGTEVLMGAYVGHEEFVRQMQSIGNYCSPRPEGLCDTLHYYDNDHLNQRGVELYDQCFYDSVLEPFFKKTLKL